MIDRFPEESFLGSDAAPAEGLHNPHSAPAGSGVGVREYEVIVPVFVRVKLRAEDELQAEVLALEAVNLLKQRPLEVVAGVLVQVRSFIAPIVGGVVLLLGEWGAVVAGMVAGV